MPRSSASLQCVLLAGVLATGCFKFDRNLAAGTLQGTAVYRNAQGALVPASGATVTLENSALSITADSKGVFALEGLPAGTFAIDLTDSPAGLTSGEVGLRLVGLTIAVGDGLDLGQVQLDSLGAIQGTLTVDGNVPGPGAIATIVGLAQVPISDGTFKFSVLLPGPYQVTVFDPTNAAGPLISPATSVQVNPAATAQAAFVLSSQNDQAAAAAVQGLVQVSGASDDSNVDVQFSGSGPDLTTSSSGTYSSGGVPAALYTVTASLGGFTSVSVPYVLVGTGTTVVPTITLLPVANGSTADAGPQPACAVDSECPAGQVCNSGTCGPFVDGGVDAGPSDAGDAGPIDAGSSDAGPMDAGPTDAGRSDAGPSDAGPSDAGEPPEAGIDAGVDAGAFDAGQPPADAGTGVAAPSGLSYSQNPADYLIWQTIAPNAPTVGGGAVASYSVGPALPAGLSLDTTTGIISGALTAVSASASYTVTAENSGGSTTCTVIISVGSNPVSGSGAVLAIGSANGCAIVAGGLMCWGLNESGQFGNNSVAGSSTPIPGGLTSGVQAVTASAAADFTCAVVNGAAECFGANNDGQLGNNSNAGQSNVPVQVLGLTSGVQAIAAGTTHACAVVNGGVQCWGSNEYDQLGDGQAGVSSMVPAQVTGLTSGAVAIAVGLEHSCALVNGGIKCWGDDGFGELGNNSQSYAPVPVSVTNPNGVGLLSGVQSIAAGDYFTCAIVNGGVDCWGEADLGQLGNNNTGSSSFVPLPVPGLTSSVQAISAGGNTACAVVGGGVQCWGSLGSSVPVAVTGLTGVQAITVGEFDACALTGNAVKCWGYNGQGQLGDNTASGGANVTVPVPVWGLSAGVQAISAAPEPDESRYCAIVSGGVQCWGNNNGGELGNNSTKTSLVPTQSLVTSGVQQLSVGGYSACAIVNGAAECWGTNGFGQLGDNSTNQSLVPETIAGLSDLQAIAEGTVFSCALVNGGVLCWGHNNVGELGNNSTTNSYVPTPVPTLTSGVQALTTGGQHICALSNGEVLCWGDNTNGELGNNTFGNSLVPAPVQGLTSGVLSVAAGGQHTCALLSGGTIQCWGDNQYGELGNDSTALFSVVPVTVSNISGGVQAIGAGFDFSCAIVNGAVQCWGDNAGGDLGNNSTLQSNVPVPVMGLTNVQSFAVGEYDACALTNGAVQCWGSNLYGQLGNNTENNSGVPGPIGPWAP